MNPQDSSTIDFSPPLILLRTCAKQIGVFGELGEPKRSSPSRVLSRIRRAHAGGVLHTTRPQRLQPQAARAALPPKKSCGLVLGKGASDDSPCLAQLGVIASAQMRAARSL